MLIAVGYDLTTIKIAASADALSNVLRIYVSRSNNSKHDD